MYRPNRPQRYPNRLQRYRLFCSNALKPICAFHVTRSIATTAACLPLLGACLLIPNLVETLSASFFTLAFCRIKGKDCSAFEEKHWSGLSAEATILIDGLTIGALASLACMGAAWMFAMFAVCCNKIEVCPDRTTLESFRQEGYEAIDEANTPTIDDRDRGRIDQALDPVRKHLHKSCAPLVKKFLHKECIPLIKTCFREEDYAPLTQKLTAFVKMLNAFCGSKATETFVCKMLLILMPLLALSNGLSALKAIIEGTRICDPFSGAHPDSTQACYNYPKHTNTTTLKATKQLAIGVGWTIMLSGTLTNIIICMAVASITAAAVIYCEKFKEKCDKDAFFRETGMRLEERSFSMN